MSDTLEFPSVQDIAKAESEAQTKTQSLSSLPVDTTYVIKDKPVKVNSKFGKSFVGDLETENGEQYKVWLQRSCLGAKLRA